MTRNLRNAYKALEKIGAPVFDHGYKNHFGISAEENYDELWADYWLIPERIEGLSEGINDKIHAILNRYNLWSEWETAGSLNIYEG